MSITGPLLGEYATKNPADGGDEAAYREKHALNREYRERLSLALDLAILARTVLWMLRGRGWRSCRERRASPEVRSAL